MIRIWGRISAFNLQKAYWALLESGAPFVRIDAGGDFGGLDDPDFLARNPNGRIPVIDDEGFILWESQAIIRYLAEQYAPHLYGESVQDRARINQWMDWSHNTLQPALLDLFWAAVRMPKEKQSASFIAGATDRTIAAMTLLDRYMADKPYMAGDAFTIADIPAGTHLYRYFEMEGLDRPNLPNITAWYTRLRQRPAFADAVMVPFDDLVGKESY